MIILAKPEEGVKKKSTFQWFRCAENNRKYTRESRRSVEELEETLLQVTRQKLASLADCVEQHDQLTVRLIPEVERNPPQAKKAEP